MRKGRVCSSNDGDMLYTSTMLTLISQEANVYLCDPLRHDGGAHVASVPLAYGSKRCIERIANAHDTNVHREAATCPSIFDKMHDIITAAVKDHLFRVFYRGNVMYRHTHRGKAVSTGEMCVHVYLHHACTKRNNDECKLVGKEPIAHVYIVVSLKKWWSLCVDVLIEKNNFTHRRLFTAVHNSIREHRGPRNDETNSMRRQQNMQPREE